MGVLKDLDSTTSSSIKSVVKKNTKSSINVAKTPMRYAKSSKLTNEEGLYYPKDGNFKSKENVVKLTNHNINGTDLSFTEVTTLLQMAMHHVEELEKVTVSFDATEKISEENEKLKEAEDKLVKTQQQFSLYKYYSFIWIFSMALFSFLVIMLITGILSSFVAISGLVATAVGGFGAYVDWKDRENNHGV